MTFCNSKKDSWWRRVLWFLRYIVGTKADDSLTYEPDDGVDEIRHGGCVMGKTRFMLEQALDYVEVAKEWPYVVRVATREHANDLTRLMCEVARERGMRIVKQIGGTAIIDGAEFHFVRRDLWDQWRRCHERFADIVEDNIRTTEGIPSDVLDCHTKVRNQNGDVI